VTTTSEAAAERRGMERAVQMLREMAQFRAQFDNELDQEMAGTLRNAAVLIAASAPRVGAR
jgi:hypothetical protein